MFRGALPNVVGYGYHRLMMNGLSSQIRSLSSSSKKFCSSGDNKIDNTVMSICNRIENTPIRQTNLFSEFMNNVTFSDGKIIMTELANRYSFRPENFLSSLYVFGSNFNWNKNLPNVLNIPLKKVIGKDTYNKKSCQEWIDVHHKLMDTYEKDIDSKVSNDGLNRVLMNDANRVIVYKDDNYDCLRLDISTTENDNDDIGTRVLSEVWKPDRRFIDNHILKVLEISSKNKYYINNLGGVIIKNIFDGSHIYENKEFDSVYGEGSFFETILWNLSFVLKINSFNKTNELLKEYMMI